MSTTSTTKQASPAEQRVASRPSRINLDKAKLQVAAKRNGYKLVPAVPAEPKVYIDRDLWLVGLAVYAAVLTLGNLYFAIWH